MQDRAASPLLLFIAALATAGIIALSVFLALDSRQVSRMETDRAALRDISYGALNADQWVARLSPILAARIERFEVTDESRPHIKALLVRVIDRLMDELPALLLKMEGSGNGMISRLLGSTGDRAIKMMLEASGIRDRSPELADALIDELQKPETKKELVLVMHGALSELAAENLPPPDLAQLKTIHTAYGCGSTPECETRIAEQLAPLQERTLLMLTGAAALALLLLMLAWRTFAYAPRRIAPLLVLAASGLLAAGVLAPMIQIDARISSLEFHILGDAIRFDDQVLYFRSKSIMDVVEILFRGGQPDLLLVGGLIALFSIGFPLMKMLSTLLLVWRRDSDEPGRLMSFFSFHSSKWAMADVFVVAMFMAFIGMRGLVNDQLGGMETSDTVTVLTTNGTALEPGFWAFLMFAIFGIAMAVLAQRWKSRGTRE
jgi:hypothetical protein